MANAEVQAAAAAAKNATPKQQQIARAPTKETVKPAGISLYHPREDCHISLTSGHTFIVPADREGIQVPKMFRREAMARGCLPVGMDEEDLGSGEGEFDRTKVIRESMHKMLESDDPTNFTGDGKPSTGALNKMCGFAVDRGERDRVWADVEKAIAEDDNPES